MIHHLISGADWAAVQDAEEFRPATLEVEGFIHCCTPAQLSGVLERYFVGATDIWVLDLDESLLAAELRWEAPADPRTGTARTSPTTEKFPHVYGPINCRAVVDSRRVC